MKYLLLFLLPLNLFSFDDLELQKSGSYSQEFTELSEELTKVKTLKSSFIQKKKIKVLKRPLVSSGELIFDRSIGVHWQLIMPYKSTIVIDNKKLTSIDDNGKKVTVKASEKPMLYGFTKIFMSIFAGNTDELKKHFQIYFKADTKGWRIGLIPTSSELKKVISKIVLSGSESTVNAITLWESNGDQTDISFSDISKANELKAEDKKKFEL